MIVFDKTDIADYVVLNCHCTQILGYYDNVEEALKDAQLAGNGSFVYKLSDQEKERMAIIRTFNLHNLQNGHK